SGRKANGQPKKVFFRQIARPSVKQFKSAMVSNLYTKGRGFGVGTVEAPTRTQGPRDNGHPYCGDYIGHWIVARGWAKKLRKTKFIDPVAGRWPGVGKRFGHNTKSFV